MVFWLPRCLGLLCLSFILRGACVAALVNPYSLNLKKKTRVCIACPLGAFLAQGVVGCVLCCASCQLPSIRLNEKKK